MERNKERPPVERGDEALAEAADLLTRADQERTRCPFCHAHLVDGSLVGACVRCETLHHLGCFAEHRGCSVNACGSSHARSLTMGEAPPLDFPHLGCNLCTTEIPGDDLLARCACGRVLHTHCYEGLGTCGLPNCKRPVEVLSHQQAQVERIRRSAKVSGFVGLFFLATFAALLAVGTAFKGPPPGDALAAIIGLSLFLGWLPLGIAVMAFLKARRIEQLPRARATGESPPAASVKPGKEDQK